MPPLAVCTERLYLVWQRCCTLLLHYRAQERKAHRLYFNAAMKLDRIKVAVGHLILQFLTSVPNLKLQTKHCINLYFVFDTL